MSQPDRTDVQRASRRDFWMALSHPILIGISPILLLFAHNISEVALSTVLPLLGMAVLTSMVLIALLAACFRALNPAAMVVSAFWILFHGFSIFGNRAYRNGYAPVTILSIWALTLAVTIGVLIYYRKRLRRASSLLFVIAVSMVGISLFQIGSYAVRNERGLRFTDAPVVKRAHAMVAGKSAQRPDIYYLLLDGYGRSDILRSHYDLDNSEFLSFLRSRGFYVADRSRTNYNFTLPALACALNGSYLDLLDEYRDVVAPPIDRVCELIHNGRILSLLREQGYRIAAFSSGRAMTSIASADVFVEPTSKNEEFFLQLLNNTPIPMLQSLFLNQRSFAFVLHRKLLLNMLDKLPELADGDVPTFTFAHFICPHPPFVFNADGSQRDVTIPFQYSDAYLITTGQMQRAEYKRAYADAVRALNGLLQKTIDEILERSIVPPIIILQGDHGPASTATSSADPRHYLRTPQFLAERYPILNAYLLPEPAARKLTPDITPVNSFRLVLSEVLGHDLPLRENRHFFCTYPYMYRYIDVTDDLPEELPR